MRGVLAEANVGDRHQLLARRRGLDGAQAALCDAVRGVGAGSLLVLGVGDAEEQQTTDAEASDGFGLAHGLVQAQVEDARHGADLAADTLALAKKQRVDQRARLELGFAHQGAQGGRGAEAAKACDGVLHGRSSVRRGTGAGRGQASAWFVRRAIASNTQDDVS